MPARHATDESNRFGVIPCNHIQDVRRRLIAHRTAWSPENRSVVEKMDRARLSIAHTFREPTPLQTETVRNLRTLFAPRHPAHSSPETSPGIRQSVCNFAHADGIWIEPLHPPRHTRGMSKLTAALLLGLGVAACETLALPGWFNAVEPRIEQALVTQFGEEERPRAADSQVLDDFWQAAEISGVALVELEIWRWMYAHPNARPADLKVAVLQIARDTWNRWYAPVIGVRDSTLLAVYSHTVLTELYLADYAVGHVVRYQIEAQMRKAGNFGAEFERISKFGDLPADLWMKNATGLAVSADSLLDKTSLALDSFDR